jgi:hypothetical protein
MTNAPRANCRWPVLAPGHATALRAAVKFIFEQFEPQAIIAAGSIVRGVGDRASDLDIYVVHAGPYKQRVQRWFAEVPVEIFVNPPPAIREYFAAGHRIGRPSTAHMIATGFPVFGGEQIEALQAEARAWLQKRSVLSADEDTMARYGAATLLEDGEDVAERDPVMATALLGEAVLAMLRYHLRTRDGIVPGNKNLMADLERSDREVAELARRFFSAAAIEERLLAGHAIADRTIRAHGFFAWDSARIPVALD